MDVLQLGLLQGAHGGGEARELAGGLGAELSTGRVADLAEAGLDGLGRME